MRKGGTPFKYPVSRAACSMRHSERPTSATWRSCAGGRGGDRGRAAPRWRRSTPPPRAAGMPDQLDQGASHIAPRSRPRRGGARWWNRRSWPARPRRPGGCSAASSGRSPTSGLGIELPVAGMQHGAQRACAAPRALGSGIEWVSVISSISNGPTENLPDSGTSVIGTSCSSPASISFGAQHRGGEGRGIDRALEPRPEILDGADDDPHGHGSATMPSRALRRVRDEAGIGHDHVDPRHACRRRRRCRNRPSATARHSRRG